MVEDRRHTVSLIHNLDFPCLFQENGSRKKPILNEEVVAVDCSLLFSDESACFSNLRLLRLLMNHFCVCLLEPKEYRLFSQLRIQADFYQKVNADGYIDFSEMFKEKLVYLAGED